MMNYIFTTQTTLSNIKKAAKKRLKADSGTIVNLAAAIEQEAKNLGYSDFHHVNACLKQTPPDVLADVPALPPEYKDWVAYLKELSPTLTKETERLFKNHFIFGFDVKDAHDEMLDDDPLYIECPDAVHFTIDGLARNGLFSFDEEEPDKRTIDCYSKDECKEFIMSDINNLAFYSPLGEHPPATIDEVRAFLKEHVFFYPDYIWFKGRLIWRSGVIGELKLA